MSYAYAVIPSSGTYSSGEKIMTVYRTDDYDRAVRWCRRATVIYRRAMRPFGGSSGVYRVINWGHEGRCVGLGYDADTIPCATR